MVEPRRLIDDPEYVQGQIAAVEAIILGLANLLLPKEDFREESLRRLEVLRTAVLGSRATDVRLLAIDHCEEWLKGLTE